MVAKLFPQKQFSTKNFHSGFLRMANLGGLGGPFYVARESLFGWHWRETLADLWSTLLLAWVDWFRWSAIVACVGLGWALKVNLTGLGGKLCVTTCGCRGRAIFGGWKFLLVSKSFPRKEVSTKKFWSKIQDRKMKCYSKIIFIKNFHNSFKQNLVENQIISLKTVFHQKFW